MGFFYLVSYFSPKTGSLGSGGGGGGSSVGESTADAGGAIQVPVIR